MNLRSLTNGLLHNILLQTIITILYRSCRFANRSFSMKLIGFSLVCHNLPNYTDFSYKLYV